MMMQPSNRPIRYVVDASVVIKWHLRDEQFVDEADSLLSDMLSGLVLLIAPDHIRYEVASAIHTAVRMARITEEDGRAAIEQFLGWHLPTATGDGLIIAAYDIARRFGCGFYDGLYLATADHIGAPLIHADRRLHNALGRRFPQELWIQDYRHT